MIYLLQGPSAAVGTVSGFLDLGTFPPPTPTVVFVKQQTETQ